MLTNREKTRFIHIFKWTLVVEKSHPASTLTSWIYNIEQNSLLMVIIYTSCWSRSFFILCKYSSNPAPNFFGKLILSSIKNAFHLENEAHESSSAGVWVPVQKRAFLSPGLRRQTRLHVKFILLTGALHSVHTTKWILLVVVARFTVTLWVISILKSLLARLLKKFHFRVMCGTGFIAASNQNRTIWSIAWVATFIYGACIVEKSLISTNTHQQACRKCLCMHTLSRWKRRGTEPFCGRQQ